MRTATSIIAIAIFTFGCTKLSDGNYTIGHGAIFHEVASQQDLANYYDPMDVNSLCNKWHHVYQTGNEAYIAEARSGIASSLQRRGMNSQYCNDPTYDSISDLARHSSATVGYSQSGAPCGSNKAGSLACGFLRGISPAQADTTNADCLEKYSADTCARMEADAENKKQQEEQQEELDMMIMQQQIQQQQEQQRQQNNNMGYR